MKKTIIYLLLFCGAVYKIYRSFDGKVSLESSIGITLFIMVAMVLISAYSIRAFGWFFKYFCPLKKPNY